MRRIVRIAAWPGTPGPNGKLCCDHDIIDPAAALIWELILVQTTDREVRSNGTLKMAV
jgi:hypothetical protein